MNIENIINEVGYGDLIKLEIPSSVQTCNGSFYGTDYAAGYFVGTCNTCEGVRLSSTQKQAYLTNEEGMTEYNIKDIKTYQILEKYELNPEEDGIDEVISFFLNQYD